jgi:hypothetical protein
MRSSHVYNRVYLARGNIEDDDTGTEKTTGKTVTNNKKASI